MECFPGHVVSLLDIEVTVYRRTFVELKFIIDARLLFDGGLVSSVYNAELSTNCRNLKLLYDRLQQWRASVGKYLYWDRATGIVYLQVVGHRNFGGTGLRPWIVEVNDRGMLVHHSKRLC